MAEADKLKFQLQINPRTKEYRYKAMLGDQLFIAGTPNVNKFEAWLNVLAAVKKKNWENNPLSKLLDKIEKGTASDAELEEAFDLPSSRPASVKPVPSVQFGTGHTKRSSRPIMVPNVVTCPSNRHEWRDITTERDRCECLHRKQCKICGAEDVIDSSD